jgi:ferritin
MISKEMQDAFNKQINEEMFSSYLYLSMAAYFDAANLPGFAQWMKVQSHEEWMHGMKFYGHIVERGGKVELFALKEPKKQWKSPLEAFEDAREHEKYITGCINKLMDLSMEKKDYASRSLLTWFVDEQVEEEASAEEIVVKLKMIGAHDHLLLMLDREMGQRGKK